MLLKKIYLENIRSYEQEEIEFAKGGTLLSGDIGSGKTSILLGIEFALFGLQPGQRGSSLLRNGKEEGKVRIEFEVDGKDIEIERILKRKKTVAQDSCFISIDGEKRELAVTELKNLVLEILNYPKEFSRKQNLLYKFTVYTPQEEMKQIILQDAESRINTLRHVFGVDRYKRILENSSIVLAKIREEKRIKEALILNLKDEEENLSSKEDQLISKKSTLSLFENEVKTKIEKRVKCEENQKEISKKIEEKIKFQQEIEKAKLMISNKRESINENKKIIEHLKIKILELQKLNFDFSILESLETEIFKFKEEQKSLSESSLRIMGQIQSLTLKNKDNLAIKEKLSHIEVCPTCLQDVNENYKKNVLNKLERNSSSNDANISDLEKNKREISSRIDLLEEKIQENQRRISELKFTKIKLEEIPEYEKRLEALEKTDSSLEKDIILLNSHLENLKNSLFEFSKFDRIFEEKQKELEQSRKEERIAEIKLAELKKEIEVFCLNIEELKERISKSREIEKELKHISELEDWISKKFIPIISVVEKNVMVKLKAEFSKLFNEWFAMLVSDSFNVYLRDDFTPVIEQQDYEIDYAYLSGGERTAIALAYRLALNQVINSMLSKIKTRNLVILDEPTDGFSEQQLDKMRDVLNQLNVEQLIIVSHEQKIEDFVENVIKFKKENNSSSKY